VSAPGGDLSKLASVASFFVSRIDIDVDALIDERLSAGTSAAERGRLEILLGKVAIANAKVAYQRDLELFGGARWEALERRGGRTPSACCGRPPAPRTRSIPTCSTARS
jgi:hypothetical protein